MNETLNGNTNQSYEKVEDALRWCPTCGKQYQISMGNCPYCEYEQLQEYRNQGQESRKRWIYPIALASAILLAVLGITFRSEISEFLRRTFVEETIFEECFSDYEDNDWFDISDDGRTITIDYTTPDFFLYDDEEYDREDLIGVTKDLSEIHKELMEINAVLEFRAGLADDIFYSVGYGKKSNRNAKVEYSYNPDSGRLYVKYRLKQ